MPKISVISPCSRSLHHMKNLRHCFKNQTFNDFEHIIVYDGQPPNDIREFFEEEMKLDSRLKLHIFDPPGGDWGTELRNFGTTIAEGEFVVFCDDDDIYMPYYLQSFADAGLDIGINTLLCCRMNNYGGILPRGGLANFPTFGDIGTPQCAFPTFWFREPYNLRWQAGGGHDFHVVRVACEMFTPTVKILKEVGIVVRGKLEDYYDV